LKSEKSLKAGQSTGSFGAKKRASKSGNVIKRFYDTDNSIEEDQIYLNDSKSWINN
jgi:hypothetical protein